MGEIPKKMFQRPRNVKRTLFGWLESERDSEDGRDTRECIAGASFPGAKFLGNAYRKYREMRKKCTDNIVRAKEEQDF